MPNLEVHKAISKRRTRKDYEELHIWIDEPRKVLSFNHRSKRHFYNTDDENFIRNKWGDKAVVEWLFHIAVDNLDTANKFAIKTYHRGYAEINISFKDKELTRIDFTKQYPNSRTTTSYKKR